MNRQSQHNNTEKNPNVPQTPPTNPQVFKADEAEQKGGKDQTVSSNNPQRNPEADHQSRSIKGHEHGTT